MRIIAVSIRSCVGALNLRAYGLSAAYGLALRCAKRFLVDAERHFCMSVPGAPARINELRRFQLVNGGDHGILR